MTKPLTAEERIARARALIEKARSTSRPQDTGWEDFAWTAQIKDTLRQANDFIKFIPMTAGVPLDVKQEAKSLMSEIIETEKQILHRSLDS